jgi:hypothetical protein
MRITVTNQGSTAVTVSSVNVGGTDGKDFSEMDDCYSMPLAAGASCEVSVTFKPGKTGPRHATLFVNDNGGGGTQTAALTGTGT